MSMLVLVVVWVPTSAPEEAVVVAVVVVVVVVVVAPVPVAVAVAVVVSSVPCNHLQLSLFPLTPATTSLWSIACIPSLPLMQDSVACCRLVAVVVAAEV